MVQKDQELREARRAAEAATARTERLQSITARLSSALTVEEVADVSVGHARAAIGAAGGSVCLLDEGGTELVVVRAVGYSDEVLEPWQRMPLSLPVPIPEAVRTGKPIFLDSKQDYIARYPALAGAKFENGDGAFAVMPLCVEDRVLGAMGLSFSSARRIDADERLFLETVAQHCAQALERARLYDAERRARAENARLYLESQRAVQAREDLLAIVSHDLRNPLGAIKLNAAQIARDTADERTARKGAIMMRAVERMERLIRDLLDAASIEAGRLSLELGRHDARALVEEIVELFTPLAAPKGIQLEAQLPESEVWVRCDRERVLQVLSNLVGNALKFTPEGGQVTVHLCHDEGVACLAISDTGPGIRADHLPHIFDRYWRGGSKVAGGAGLGLYIAQGIVSAHGGRIEVESEPGTGTTFRFSLALANEAPEASE
jgi:signal transduction histidine kinase